MRSISKDVSNLLYEKMASNSRFMSQVFAQMLVMCPNEISIYGKCLSKSSDDVIRGSCEKEFQAIKSCFRQVFFAIISRLQACFHEIYM